MYMIDASPSAPVSGQTYRLVRLFLYGFVLWCVLLAPAGLHAATYYVDNQFGDNANPGTSPDSPWKSPRRINLQHFAAKDTILFKRGGEWLDVSIEVKSPALTIGAYGVGAPPRLLGSLMVKEWTSRADGLYSALVRRPLKHQNWSKWSVQLVMEDGNYFYKKVETFAGLTEKASFYHDMQTEMLYVHPREAKTFLDQSVYVGHQENVIEITHAGFEHLEIRDLEISMANRYGVGVWWQGDEVIQGQVLVEDNLFIGNAFSAICLSGGMSYDAIVIRNNVIRRNGAEGIYIGKYATRRALEITGNVIGHPDDDSFGWRGEGPRSAFNGDGIDVKTGNRGVRITKNLIQNLTGYCGICFGSGEAVVAENLIKEISMDGADWPFSAVGIFLDIDDEFGPAQILDNRMILSRAGGISVRGNARIHPGAIIQRNEISLASVNPNSQINFTVMNSHNVQILQNRGRGGAYGLYLYGTPPHPPVGLRVAGNEFLQVSKSIFSFGQRGPEDMSGLKVADNIICQDYPRLVEWQHGKLVKDQDFIMPEQFVRQNCTKEF